MAVVSSSISILWRKEISVRKTQNHPLRAFTLPEEQELHRTAKATGERLDVVNAKQQSKRSGPSGMRSRQSALAGASGCNAACLVWTKV